MDQRAREVEIISIGSQNSVADLSACTLCKIICIRYFSGHENTDPNGSVAMLSSKLIVQKAT